MLSTMVFINIFVLILPSINMIYLFKIRFKNHDYYDFNIVIPHLYRRIFDK